MTTFAHKVLQFYKQLSYTEKLPHDIRIMNPFQDNPEILSIAALFYNKFYHDHHQRKLILGINPGRLGAGATGIPFTDTKRLQEICGIKIESINTYEPSSVYIYDLIHQYGGADKFYNDFYIGAVCPLGFVEKNNKQHWVNCNYYDSLELFEATEHFIIISLKQQIDFGIDTNTCFVLGKKNAKFLQQINNKEKLFRSIVALDHPRYIQQYKSKQKDLYIAEYLSKLAG